MLLSHGIASGDLVMPKICPSVRLYVRSPSDSPYKLFGRGLLCGHHSWFTCLTLTFDHGYNASTSPVLDNRRDIGTRRATFSVSPSKWENSCNATVSLSQPFESTIASKTCRYCSQLVVPPNRGTFVVVNAACRGYALPEEPPVFATASSQFWGSPSPVASEQPCQPAHLPATRHHSVGPNRRPLIRHP